MTISAWVSTFHDHSIVLASAQVDVLFQELISNGSFHFNERSCKRDYVCRRRKDTSECARACFSVQGSEMEDDWNYWAVEEADMD